MLARLSESPSARSKSFASTATSESDTFGVRHASYSGSRSSLLSLFPLKVLNRQSNNHPGFQVGVSEDKGSRRTMEDAHSYVVDFDNIRGQGLFAVFDGHAGKHAAEWCGSHFHETLLKSLHACPTTPIPDVLNKTFHDVDEHLSRICEESDGKIHSGCTAVTAFLRVEDADGSQAFLRQQSPSSTSADSSRSRNSNDREASPQDSSNESNGPTSGDDSIALKKSKKTSVGRGYRLRQALKSLGSGSISGIISSPSSPKTQSPALSRRQSAEGINVIVPPPNLRRVLYSANAGDARGVLCRAGKAIRLTYDHKGTDKQEAKRIQDAGGFVMSGRVNGVLAVTRSLGDPSMKEFVVGAPYTTETVLCEDDEFLILACDGLWDVASDQNAVELVRDIQDAQHASQKLLKYALSQHTTDNVTIIVVRFKHPPKSP
ncbi:hypothetical protein AX16_002094 [Volvariella volvacea WC 439]|nr:hypothetical protein AX16_002094 [Volvariella volvacea WC 439]